ncbi:MAG: hypothetical protein JWM07_601 [Candidatus Saccharibacteria bacterium]|nr:hypothetical protein [Candidatus Saccharibacteria bacterium]
MLDVLGDFVTGQSVGDAVLVDDVLTGANDICLFGRDQYEQLIVVVGRIAGVVLGHVMLLCRNSLSLIQVTKYTITPFSTM